RNLKVRPLADDAPAAPPGPFDATDLQLARLREQGFPLVDFHTRLAGGLTLDDVMSRAWRTGLGAGVVVRGGADGPVTDDPSAETFLQTVRGRPVFVGLHVEGRDGVRRFSPATVARFDYVLADALTLTDPRGRRVRLWVKDEVDVPDPQAFLDRLVQTVEDLLDRGPIDVYASPTYPPEGVAAGYDRLGTPERVRRGGGGPGPHRGG